MKEKAVELEKKVEQLFVTEKELIEQRQKAATTEEVKKMAEDLQLALAAEKKQKMIL